MRKRESSIRKNCLLSWESSNLLICTIIRALPQGQMPMGIDRYNSVPSVFEKDIVFIILKEGG